MTEDFTGAMLRHAEEMRQAVNMPRTADFLTSAQSPYAGSVEPPEGAGTRDEPAPFLSEHRAPNGMLNGGHVAIRSSSRHGLTTTEGRIVDISSVPAPHLVVDMDNGKRRIVFCAAIEYIERLEWPGCPG